MQLPFRNQELFHTLISAKLESMKAASIAVCLCDPLLVSALPCDQYHGEEYEQTRTAVYLFRQ